MPYTARALREKSASVALDRTTVFVRKVFTETIATKVDYLLVHA